MAKNAILSFGLVSIEVKIDNAVKSLSKDVQFDSASPDGAEVKQVYVDEKGNTYSRSELAKGKFVDGSFHEIPADQVEDIKDSIKTDTVELRFAPAKSVDLSCVTGKHYVEPKAGYADKLRLLVEAMKKSKSVFVAKWVPVSRQSLVVGVVEGNNLVLLQVPFVEQMKEAPKVDGDKPTAKALEMAVKLITASTDEGYRDEATDEGVALKQEAIQNAINGKPVKKATKAKAKVKSEDLEDLLAASLN